MPQEPLQPYASPSPESPLSAEAGVQSGPSGDAIPTTPPQATADAAEAPAVSATPGTPVASATPTVPVTSAASVTPTTPAAIEPSYAPTGEERAARRADRANRAHRVMPKFVAAGDESQSPVSPLVSVIVTVHDAAETVRYCVDSILRQSYANLEVILVDDGSNDDGPAILDEYARRDDRVKTIMLSDLNASNGGGERGDKPDKSGTDPESEVMGPESETEPSTHDAAIPVDDTVPVDDVDHDAPDHVDDNASAIGVVDSAIDAIDDAAAENGDVAARARNAGLDATHGEYVAFVGSDGVLDRRAIELLLHALIKTGADMAKSHWERFTPDQLYAVSEVSAEGAREPESVTVFTDALEAYQSVFLKSVRVLGDEFGHNTEARYLNDEDWGRLYRASVWDDVRLPEGIYSPELLAAGELYSRMSKVADMDVVLYRVLDGDADERRRFRYYHDRFTAGTANFRFAFDKGILPARSYYTMVTAYEQAKSAPDFDVPEHQEQFALDTAELEELRGKLTFAQRMQCMGVRRMRLFEESVKRILPASLAKPTYSPDGEELA
ncbi:glycosyltransferase [Bifidobacterium callitrichos]|uniref:Glycosyltransferase n=2 Tax=Bifidobacterium callitrichos TaxID=762209 RepID=A0A5M9ZCQ1_9BIFI|nr:glycosyltransferase [Bifidobacterium callitrichos]